MNPTAVRSAALERMFDGALLEVLTGSAAAALVREAQPPVRPLQAWFAAALVFLGIGVATTIWWLRATPAVGPAQGTDALPPAVKVAGEAIAALDPACANLNWEDVQPRHLPLLSRFPHLRRLRINPDTAPGSPAAWQAVPAADLQPVCALEQLEELHLPYCWSLTAAHLRQLGTCHRLRSLSLVNQSVVLDETVVAELAQWPALRELHLLVIQLTGRGLAALARLPRLQELELWRCRGLDGDGIAAVARSPGLQSLHLVGLGRSDPRPPEDQTAPAWTLTPAAMAAIARMPALRELVMDDCVLTDTVLAEVPHGLRSLGIARCELPVAALRTLRRLARLQSLAVGGGAGPEGQEGFADEVANLLGTLRLERLDWQGACTPAIVAALSAQPDLRELGLAWHEGTDLGFVVGLPKLQVLGVTVVWPATRSARPLITPPVSQPGGGDLQPLRQCRSLQRVELRGAQAGTAVAPLREAVAPRIAVWLVE